MGGFILQVAVGFRRPAPQRRRLAGHGNLPDAGSQDAPSTICLSPGRPAETATMPGHTTRVSFGTGRDSGVGSRGPTEYARVSVVRFRGLHLPVRDALFVIG